MTKLRTIGFRAGLVAVGLVGGTMISAFAAAPPRSSSATAAGPASDMAADARSASEATSGHARGLAFGALENAAEYCETFRDAFAAKLGVDESALGPAAKAAAITTIDAAVAKGDITEAVGERLKAKVNDVDDDACGWLGTRLERSHGAVGIMKDGATAAAEALKMTPAELRAALKSGKDLKSLAASQGVSYKDVSGAIVAAVKADLDAAVKAGKIKQARADRILGRLERNLADGRLRR
jgi:ribosomal protein S20